MANLPSVTEGLIEKVQIGTNGTAHSIAATAYAECNTPASTQVKSVDMTGFQLIKGVTVRIKFTYNNTSSAAPQLDVNGTGAKLIKLYGTTDAGTDDETTGWQAGAVISFTYDGTYWVREQGYNTNSTYEVKDTYSGTDGNPISGKGVKAAIETLDVSNITANLGASKTITALSETDGKIAATASDIQIAESQVTNLTTDLGNKMPKSGGQFTGDVSFASGKKLTVNTPSSDSEAATKKYVDDKTASLTGAMHFKGVSTTAITDGGTENPTIGGTAVTTKAAGDVVIYGDQEYVWSTTNKWELLGDEGSYALKSKTDKAIKSLGFTANTQPSLTITETTIPNVTNAGSAPQLTVTETSIPNVTSAGSVTTAEVTNGTLLITMGSATTLGTAIKVGSASGWNAGSVPTLGTAIKVGSASGWNAGSQASVNPSSIDVVIP